MCLRVVVFVRSGKYGGMRSGSCVRAVDGCGPVIAQTTDGSVVPVHFEASR